MNESVKASSPVRHFAESLAAQIVDAVPVGLAIADRTGALLFMNAQLLRMTGYSADELLGRPIEILLPERHRSHHVAERDAYLAQPSLRPMGAGRDLFARRRDGSEFPVEVGLQPMDTAEGLMVMASIIEVSERRRVEANFAAVVESAPYGMLLANGAGVITLVNRHLCGLFGYTRAELLGQRVEMLLPMRHRAAHVGQRETFAAAPAQRAMGDGRDLTARRKDGREFPAEIALNTVHTPSGPMTLAAVVDITKRKRAELDLKEANAQLEEFTYVASHDLKSPIRGIANLMQWIKEDLGEAPPEAVAKNLDRMEIRVSRMERLIEDLLTYARAGRRSTRVEAIDVPKMIQEIVDLEPLPAGMSLDLNIQVREIEGARTPLSTALRNLFANAVKHHDKADGRVAIEVREEGSYCVFSVTDDGPGIPEAAHQRVFRLFQTLTAAERMGSGLGLAVAKRLVENHGGRIELTSVPASRGCTFRIWWPRFIRSDLNE